MNKNQQNFFTFIDSANNPTSADINLTKTIKNTVFDNYKPVNLSKRQRNIIKSDLQIKAK